MRGGRAERRRCCPAREHSEISEKGRLAVGRLLGNLAAPLPDELARERTTEFALRRLARLNGTLNLVATLLEHVSRTKRLYENSEQAVIQASEDFLTTSHSRFPLPAIEIEQIEREYVNLLGMIISRMDSVLLTERQKTERIGEMLNAMVIIRESVSNQERWELVRMKISRLGDMAEDLRELDEFSAEVETAALDDSAPTLLSTEINQARQKVTDLASASISHQEEKWDRNRNDWRNQIKRVGRFVLNTSRLMASSSHGFIVYALSALVGVGLWMVCGEGWILLSSLDIFSFGLFTFLLDWSVKEIWKELEEGIDVAQLFINGIMRGFSMATVFFFVSLYLWSPGHFPAFRRKRVTH